MMVDLAEINISWTSILLAIGILGVTYFLYYRIIKPYRQFCAYCSQISPEYKVYVDYFNPFFPNFITRLRNDFQKHGDAFHTSKYQLRHYHFMTYMFRDRIAVTLFDPNLIRQFFQKSNEGYYPKSQNSLAVTALKFMLGKGLAFSQGNQWKMKRKIMTTVFNYDFIKTKVSTISQIAAHVLDKIEESKENRDQKQIKMDLETVFQEIFGNVVIKCFFGSIKLQDIQGESPFNYFSRLAELNLQRGFTIYALMIGPRYLNLNLRPIDRQVNKMYQNFNTYAENVINNHLITQYANNAQKEKESNESSGVIQQLIKSQKLKSSKEGSQNHENRDFYTTQDLIDQFKTFFFAGTDTTTSSTATLIYQIAKHKQAMSKLRQQIRQIFGDGDAEITYQKLKQMKYLQKCIKQVLRMYSPAPNLFNRQATKDHYLGNVAIKAGMIVQVSILTASHNESLSMNAQIFNPDRWDAIDSNKKDPYLYIPFSSGQRNCIGQHLAMLQSKIVIILLLKRYRQIILQKPDFRFRIKTTYGAQKMVTTFIK